jgi:tetratricopeptide (TPR) repeat protein
MNNSRANVAYLSQKIRIIMRCFGVICMYAPTVVCMARAPISFAQSSQSHPSQAKNPTPVIVDALRHQNFDRALQLSSAALKRAPSDHRLWTLSGMAYAGTNQSSLALGSYNRALKFAPNYLPALEGAAQIEFRQGSDNAKQLILRVLALVPADPTSHAMLGALAYKRKNCVEASSYFQQAASLIETQPELLVEYASCLAALDRYEEVIPLLQRVLSIDPSRQSVRYNLALAQWNGTHTQDALATLQPLLLQEPGDEDILTLAADIYESNNDTPHAVEVLRQAILANPKKPNAYLQFSTLSYNHGSLPVGIDMLNAGVTQLPDEPRLYLSRAVLYTEKGDLAKAMDDFETVNRLNPNLSLAGVAEGLARSQQHRSKEALASFRAAAKAHPDDAFTQYLLAEALSEQEIAPETSEYAEEFSAATRAVTLDPKMLSALNLLSTLSLRDGHTQRAIDYCRQALSVDANDQQALYHLLLALRKTDNRTEVAAVLKRLVAVRNAEQSRTQKMRYKLDEVQAELPSIP